MKKPLILPWRSPLFLVFSEDAQWQPIGDSKIVVAILDSDSDSDSTAAQKAAEKAEEKNAMQAGICDLSPLSRIGGKGKCTQKAPSVNTVAMDNNNMLFCRVGEDEALVLSTSGDKAILGNYLPQPRIVIPRRDSHCQIGLCGARADEVLSRLCAVPPPQYPHLLQTRVADLSALIIPALPPKPETQTAYYILADSGYALHLWNALHHVATQLGGGIIGWQQWQKVCKTRK